MSLPIQYVRADPPTHTGQVRMCKMRYVRRILTTNPPLSTPLTSVPCPTLPFQLRIHQTLRKTEISKTWTTVCSTRTPRSAPGEQPRRETGWCSTGRDTRSVRKEKLFLLEQAQAGAGMVGSRATGSVQKGSRDITWWLLFAQISDDERALRPLSPLADACTTRSLPYRDLSALEPAQTGAFPPVGSSVRSMQETPASAYLHARVRAIRKTFCCRVSVRVAGACLCLVGRLPRWSTILEAAAMSPSLLSRS